jgi:dienelactone hydrolase
MRHLRLARLASRAVSSSERSRPLDGTPFVVFALAAAVGAAPACSSSSHGSASSQTPPAGPVAHFVLGDGTTPPNLLDVPFPTDAYLANGAALPAIPGLANLIGGDTTDINYAFSKLNGFSRLALSIFAVDDTSVDAGGASATIDPATLPVAETDCTKATSSVFLLDLQASSPSAALLPCRAAFHDDRPNASTTPVVAVGPPRGYVLQEGHQYAAVLTSRVKDTHGRSVAASTDFDSVVKGTAKGAVGSLYATAYAAAATALKSALASDGASIVSIAPYTTMKKTGELFAMRETLETSTPPKLAWDAATLAPMGASRFAKVTGTQPLPSGFTASLDAWLGVVPASGELPDGTDNTDNTLPVRAHDQIASLGTAVFTAQSYLQVEPTGYADRNHGTFAFDASGNPVPQAPVKIWVTFAVPTSPMPAGGYPVVIVQHGLGGSREILLDIANTFAKAGWAVAAIDSVTFGARAAESADTVDAKNNFAAGSGATYNGPDGFADVDNSEIDFFGSLSSMLAISDQMREAGFDTAQLVQVLRSNPDLSPLALGTGTAPAIDGSRIAYLGQSLGALEGTIAAALEPHVSAWILDVNAGSFFLDTSTHSPAFGPLLSSAATINFDLPDNVFTWSNPAIQILQTVFEPGDPAQYGPYVVTSPHTLAGAATKPRNVVQTEDIWDELVTDEGNESVARAMGLTLAAPNVGSNADLTDVANAASNPRATPFSVAMPDSSGAIHDTPMAGTTAVLVQCGPCEHGIDFLSSQGAHSFAAPFVPPFTMLPTPESFTEPFQSTQAMMVTFFGDAFQGNVPRVMGFATPVRDDPH